MRFVLALVALGAASAATLEIPAAGGLLALDGSPAEALWSQARVLPLTPAGFGAPFPEGGEARAIVRGGYLCLAARLPEPDRISAYSRGRGAALGREDAIVFTFRVKPPAPRAGIASLTIGALGGFKVEYSGSNPPDVPLVLARAAAGAHEWTVEAAIPLANLDSLGFLTVERIRVPRPEAPELRWYWPGANDRAAFTLPLRLRARGADPRRAAARPPRRPARPVFSRRATLVRGGAQGVKHRPHGDATTCASAWPKPPPPSARPGKSVRTRADWERFRDQRLAALRASLSPCPSVRPCAPPSRAASTWATASSSKMWPSKAARTCWSPPTYICPPKSEGAFPLSFSSTATTRRAPSPNCRTPA